MDYKVLLSLILSVYAGLLSTYIFYFDRAGRIKITYEFCTNYLIGDGMFTTMYFFTLISLSAKKRIISSIGYQFHKLDDTIYSPIERFKKRVSLEFGELIYYEVRYNDFDNLFDNVNARKFRLVVRDTTGKRYKTKWIKIKRVAKSTGKISEIKFKLNDTYSITIPHNGS